MKEYFHAALFILAGFISSCTSVEKTESKNNLLLGQGFGITGATIMVKNLDSVRNYYAKVLGFPMPPREKFEKGIYEGTLSVGVSFPDWSYLEFLSTNDTGRAKVKDSFITSFLKNYEGVRLYSLSTSSADTTFN